MSDQIRYNSKEKIHHVNRIVVFTLDSLYSGVGIHKFVEHFPGRVVLLCASKRYNKKHGSFIKQLIKNFRRSGWKFVNYLSYHFVYYYPTIFITDMVNKVLNKPKRVYTIDQLAKKYSIPIVKTDNPNSPEIIELIKKAEPDLIVSAYFDHVIRLPIINIPRFGVVNIHTALLPDYRGPFPALWPLIKGEKRIGVTIHYINSEDLDSGPIVAQHECSVIPDESVLGTDCRLFKNGIKLLPNVIYQIEDGTLKSVGQEEKGRGSYFSFPRVDDLKNFKIPLVSIRDYIKQFIHS